MTCLSIVVLAFLVAATQTWYSTDKESASGYDRPATRPYAQCDVPYSRVFLMWIFFGILFIWWFLTTFLSHWAPALLGGNSGGPFSQGGQFSQRGSLCPPGTRYDSYTGDCV